MPVASGAPTITSLTPSNGPLSGGTVVTINGTNFGDVFGVSFGNTPSLQVTDISSSQVQAVAPAGVVPGKVDVSVVNAAGSSVPGPGDGYTYSGDGDGYTDINEAGTPLCANAVNDDGVVGPGTPTTADDNLVNDGCPAVGPAESGAQCTNNTDDDGDGFYNDGCPQVGTYAEGQFNIGTSPQAPCGTDWPSNVFNSGPSANKLDVQDVISFVAPIRRMGTNPGDPNFSSRYDLVPGKGILATWINLNDLTALIAGTTGFPPMFNGARAFGHVCPIPP